MNPLPSESQWHQNLKINRLLSKPIGTSPAVSQTPCPTDGSFFGYSIDQGKCPRLKTSAIREFSGQFTFEHQQNMALFAPVVRLVSWRVLDKTQADIPYLQSPPRRVPSFPGVGSRDFSRMVTKSTSSILIFRLPAWIPFQVRVVKTVWLRLNKSSSALERKSH